jgi:hypothetical protein
MNAEKDLDSFRKFLETIPLEKLRKETKEIKWVEQDLPKEILPLESIFRYYWEKKEFLDFDKWFDDFWQELHSNPQKKEILEQFKSYYFDNADNEWFKKGFRARMYRTWISVLTQLDFCYVFAYISEKFGKKYNLIVNAELDRKGIDLRVVKNNLRIDFQVAKISERKEARSAPRKKNTTINIPYPVFNLKKLQQLVESKRVKPENKKKYKSIIDAFNKYFKTLKNGFIVFNEEFVEGIVQNIEDINKLKNFIDKVYKDLKP